VTDGHESLSARETARRLLATPQASAPAQAAPVQAAQIQAATPARRNVSRTFADHPDIVTTRERRARAQEMVALTGMPSPLFLERRGPNEAVIDMPDELSGPHKRTMSNFSSYNYLGLAAHPDVVRAAQDALAQYGASASASRIFSGGIDLYTELESRLAQIYDVDQSVITTSGYLANAGVIGFLLGERDALVCDALDHASIVSGGQWSGARQLTFRHNDPDSLRNVLRMSRDRFERVLVVIEAHYSMDGDIGRLPEIAAVAREFECGVMVDEAHSFGVLGARGHGVREHFDLPGDAVDIWMGTLSKALGSCGGFIAGNGDLIEAIRTIAPGVEQFTGGPSPAAAAAALAALDVLDSEPDRLTRLWRNAKWLTSAMRERELDLGLSQNTPICPVLVPGEFQVGFVSSMLLQRGVYVGPVVSPGVPPGQERLRFFVTSEHTEEQLRSTADLVSEVIELATRLANGLSMSNARDLVTEMVGGDEGPS
jgi:8-amino-7-oxononanoate synthase